MNIFTARLRKAKCLFMLLDLEVKTGDLVRLINQNSINF